MAVAGLANLAFFGAEAFLPLSLTSLHHRSVTEAGVVLTVAALTWTVGSWVQARNQGTVGPRRLCAAGLLFVAVGVTGVGTLDWGSTPWWVAFVAWGLAGAGMGLLYATTTLVVLAGAGSGRQGGPVAALGVLVTLGVAVGTGVGGAALALSVSLGHGRAPGLRAVDAVCVGAALVGLLLCSTVPRAVPTTADESADAVASTVARDDAGSGDGAPGVAPGGDDLRSPAPGPR
jgi:MFS family permease